MKMQWLAGVHIGLIFSLCATGFGGQSTTGSTTKAWDVSNVPVVTIPAKDGTWSSLYKDYAFALATQTYREDPAFAYVVFQKHNNASSPVEAKGGKKDGLSEEQKVWFRQTAESIRPAALLYCQWVLGQALQEKDARTAMAATLLWQQVEFLNKPQLTNDVQRLAQTGSFFAGEQQAKAMALLREEMNGTGGGTPQWKISEVSTSWVSEYEKSYGLGRLTVSPPEGKTFLHVRALVQNIGAPCADPSSLPLYQDSPRDFNSDTALDWWTKGTNMYLATPHAQLPQRRLLSVDMVNLIDPAPSGSGQSPLFPKEFVPCHVVGDDCDVLRGPLCDTLLVFVVLSGKAVNPTLLSTGSWVGPGTKCTVEAYFAVRQTPQIDYSLHVMGSPPVKLPQPK